MNINYLAVVVAAVLNMAIGALWYSPVLFAKQWLQAVGKKDMGQPGPGYAISTVGSLVMALILAYVAGQVGATTFMDGVKIGLVAWAGFVATTYASSYVFEGRTIKLYAINTGYFLVSLVLMGGLLAAWH